MTQQFNNNVCAESSKHKLAYDVEPSTHKYRLRLARYKALAEAVFSFIREREGEQLILLDIGVGSGRSMRYIEAEGGAKFIDFYGLDLSPKRLKRVYNPERWYLFQSDIQQGAPFPPAYFDIVICEQALEHLSAPATAMDEIARLLKPNGLLVVGVPIFPWGISQLRKLLVRVSMDWFGVERSHMQTFDSRSIKRIIRAYDRFQIFNSYGVRMVSGGLISSLEHFFWWYRFNRWLGRTAPGLCTEIQILARRSHTS